MFVWDDTCRLMGFCWVSPASHLLSLLDFYNLGMWGRRHCGLCPGRPCCAPGQGRTTARNLADQSIVVHCLGSRKGKTGVQDITRGLGRSAGRTGAAAVLRCGHLGSVKKTKKMQNIALF
jgi:hypothetical protein